jgi:hypothetical protein
MREQCGWNKEGQEDFSDEGCLSVGRVLNPGPPEYEAKVLTIGQRFETRLSGLYPLFQLRN